MKAPIPNHLQGLDTNTFAADAKRRERQLIFLVTALSLGLGFAYTVRDSPLIPLVLLLVIAVPLVLWRWPNVLGFLIFASACLFEIFPLQYPDSITDLVPIFWNLNTIMQRYAPFGF